MGYEYDVFISYRSEPPVGEWVRRHFAPLLGQWLNESCTRPVRIYVDRLDLVPGSEWPVELRDALSRSRFLVPVLSPSYFRSEWCLAELATMQARERHLGHRRTSGSPFLIFPVKFNDGKHFADSVKGITTVDLSDWNQPSEAFAQTPAYVDLTKAIERFAEGVADRLDSAPEWDPDWPVETPVAEVSYELALPRLGTES